MLYQIARQYQISVEERVYQNQLRSPGVLSVGQALLLPGACSHIVTAGESLYAIAKAHGLSLHALIASNPQLKDPDRLPVGACLSFPGDTESDRCIVVNGFASNVSDATLAESLPYLSFLSAFSYRAAPDGSLTPRFDVTLTASEQNGVVNLMTVTNLMEKGGFSPELAHALLRDTAVQDRLVEQIFSVLEGGLFGGVNLDLEYVPPEERQYYNQFLARLADALHRGGWLLTTSLAPKRSDRQEGLLYSAHDYAFHGQVADYVILMTYEWGYTYGPPMAVAPLDMVRRVLDYAVTEIPKEKILMGIPNYGYDWTLPYRQGVPARALTNVRAVTLAGEMKQAIEFDEAAEAPYFYYNDTQGQRHVVWFEDARSIRAKLGLAEQYRLGGVSIWNINNLYRTNFLSLAETFHIQKR